MLNLLNIKITQKQIVGLIFLTILLVLFISFSRFPKLDEINEDLEAVTKPVVECFQGFCVETEKSLFERWKDFSIAYFEIISVGMIFAFLVAGLTETFIIPTKINTYRNRGVIGQTFIGLSIGPVWNLCSACVVPIANSFHRKGSGSAYAVGMVQGSSTLNLPAIIMSMTIFTPLLGLSRIIMSLSGALIISPLVALAAGDKTNDITIGNADDQTLDQPMQNSFRQMVYRGIISWMKSSLKYLIRLGPIMIVAGVGSGLVLQWISSETVSGLLGDNITGILIAATFGLLINVPLLFEIPLVALLVIMGMGISPAATLLYVAAAGGPITFWGLSQVLPKKAIIVFAISTWTTGVVGGIVVWIISSNLTTNSFLT